MAAYNEKPASVLGELVKVLGKQFKVLRVKKRRGTGDLRTVGNSLSKARLVLQDVKVRGA
jgi:hypothetical protein